MKNKLGVTIFVMAMTGLCSGLWAQTTRPAVKALPADQMLNRMLQPKGTVAQPLQPVADPETDKSTGAAAVAPGAPTQTVVREGTYLVDRIGRLTRGGEGKFSEFSFEADGRTLGDPPVVILPNLKLMLMEDAVKNAARDLRFQVTGLVTEYRGRNYILLEKVVVAPDVTQPLK